MLIRTACRIASLVAITIALAACGRAGAPLRPEPGTIIMQPDAQTAPAPTDDKPFVLDPLL